MDLSDWFVIIGLFTLAIGIAMIYIPAGIIFAGLSIIAIGKAVL